MKELLIEGQGLNKKGGNVWIGRVGGWSSLAIPLGNIPTGNEASESIDRYILNNSCSMSPTGLCLLH